ncbi:integrase [Streptomyces sp. CBMA152]|nr:integrase [Streptomyces sp. CBMA152]MBD0741887.1 integrase [Streptomyces sp. CBMA152]
MIKEFFGHARIGVTASVYAHLRLRLPCQAITLGDAIGQDDPPAAAVVV